MTRIFASLIVALLLFPATAFAESVDWDDLVERDGLNYKKFTDEPFDGEVTGKRQGSFSNGEKHGPWVKYHDNGQLRFKGVYKNGKKDGPWKSYWENGQLWKKVTYKNDKMEGYWESYDWKGQLVEKSTGTYKNGVKVD